MDYWLGIPLLNGFAAMMRAARRRPWPAQAERIGVMCSPALGDTLLFSAVLHDIRAQFPDAKIVHICMRQNLSAAELLVGADRRLLVKLTRPIETIRLIRKEKFDVLFDFTAWQRLTAFCSLMSGARFTVGFRTAGQHRGLGYDVAVEHRNDRHELENFRALCAAVGVAAKSAPSVSVPEISAEPLADARDLVVFHPWAGTQSTVREWPEDYWIALGKALATPETTLAITGGPGDSDQMALLHQRMEKVGLRSVPFVGSDGFVSLGHLLRRARVVVSVNTGVMHLAAVVGAPTVSINGPTRNERWGPVGNRVVGVAAPGEGCGYLNLGFEFDGHPADCMERTTVEMVLAAARGIERSQSRDGLQFEHVEPVTRQ